MTVCTRTLTKGRTRQVCPPVAGSFSWKRYCPQSGGSQRLRCGLYLLGRRADEEVVGVLMCVTVVVVVVVVAMLNNK